MISLDVEKRLSTGNGKKTLHIAMGAEQGDFMALYGPSGSGKTTTLRMLAGLTKPESGEIAVNGAWWFNAKRGINMPARERRVGFVFQDFALFPAMTVRENVLYAAGKDVRLADRLIGIMELTLLQHAHPSHLSGGQRQRCALARALANRPGLLLLDEPLSSLDGEMRNKLQDLLAEIHRDMAMTILMVSHEMTEIYKLANSVVCYGNNGIIRQGTPSEVFFKDRYSMKFKVTGTILCIKPGEALSIVSVAIGADITQVAVDNSDIEKFKIGRKVIVAAKAFSPILLPLEQTTV
jgi:molybdate transport system ATP-binding protein